MPLKGADILSADQFTRDDMEALFALADEFTARLNQGERLRILDGKLLTTLFYEPSTRTQLAFQAAMQKLGGGILTSTPTGETLAE